MDPSFQGLGLGKTVIERIIEDLQRKGILNIALKSEPRVLGFYRPLGFVADRDAIRGMAYSRKKKKNQIQKCSNPTASDSTTVFNFQSVRSFPGEIREEEKSNKSSQLSISITIEIKIFSRIRIKHTTKESEHDSDSRLGWKTRIAKEHTSDRTPD